MWNRESVSARSHKINVKFFTCELKGHIHPKEKFAVVRFKAFIIISFYKLVSSHQSQVW